jgi:HemY protein
MIRVLVFLAFLAVAAAGAVWLADRPGEVMLTWQGQEIRTSLMVAVSALAALLVAAIMVWSVVRFVLRSPDLVSLFFANRRKSKGFDAITRGMVAVGAGDLRTARKYAYDARRLAGDQPLALLLQAQTAQLGGDRGAAALTFQEMAAKPDTKLIGLRGLYMEAVGRGDPADARRHAEEAARLAPGVGWAGQAELDFRCAAGEWTEALATVERNIRNGVVEPAIGRRQKAVLLTARAMELEDGRRDEALDLATEALKIEPALVPAAVLAGRILSHKGDLRRASKILETAWKAAPHPQIADTYAHVRQGDAARDRLKRVRALTSTHTMHVESALAVARAAIEAADYELARRALTPHLGDPTQRVCLAMARLEQAGNDDAGAARGWIARAVRARRDAAWTADGVVSADWKPVSPVTGRLDAFEWKVPVTEADGAGLLIDEVPDTERKAPADIAPIPVPIPPPVVKVEPVPVVEAPSPPVAKVEPPPPPPPPEPAAPPPPVIVAPPPEPVAPPAPPRPSAQLPPVPHGTMVAAPPRTVPAPVPALVAGPAPAPVPATPEPKPAPALPAPVAPQAETTPRALPAPEPVEAGPRRLAAPAPQAAPVIPFVQAPDDPGPDGDPALTEQPRRRFGLF